MASSQPQVNLTGLGMTLQKVEDIPNAAIQRKKFMPFYLKELDSTESTYKEIVTDFKNADMKVIKIESLQNTMKMKAYKSNRDLLYEQRTGLDPNFNVNEKYLYHGTAANKRDICEVGLDDKLSGNGCFGKGIYFSDNPRKCAKYANRAEGDEGLIVCARVILGDSKVYPKGKQDRGLLREPEKSGSGHGWRFYDSVQGCPTDFKEYIVYRASSVLVEYLITYSIASVRMQRNFNSEIQTCLTKPRVPSKAGNFFKAKVSALSTNISQATSYHSHTKSALLKGSTDTQHFSSTSTTLKSQPLVNADEALSSSNSSDSEEDEKHGHGDGSDSDTTTDEDVIGRTKRVADSDTESSESELERHQPSFQLQAVRKPSQSQSLGSTKDKERLLALKKKQFSKSTGEFSEYLVETFLQASDFDVDKAVNMYHDKKMRDDKSKTEPVEVEVVRGDVQPVFIQGKTVPDYNTPEWKSMTEADKEAAIKILVDNFLSITFLSKAEEQLASKLLKLANYDLDQAIVSYYEAI